MTVRQCKELCTQSISPLQLQEIRNFIPTIQKMRTKKVKEQLIGLLLTEGLIVVICLFLARDIIKLVSFWPFFLLIFIPYGLLILSTILMLSHTIFRIQNALQYPEQILMTPDTYQYTGQSHEKVGNDVSSDSMDCYRFKNTDTAQRQCLYLGQRSHNFYYDTLVKGLPYHIYLVADSYILVIASSC